jgi:NADPH:quinone reductase-like Zn-dependent oxidoreductase
MHRTGGPDVLVYEDVPDPRPASGEVLIKVESASVNFADAVRRRGDPYPYPSPLPFIPGGEVAGVVAAYGEGVSDPPIGTPVFAILGNGGAGGYAEYAVAPRPQLVRLPPPLDTDFDRACTLVIAGVTALQVLTSCAHMERGETVWIPAAAGGVGTYAVQLAKVLGAGKVIAGVGSKNKVELVRSLGADDVIDYTEEGWTERVKASTGRRGVDVALEMTGGTMLEQTLSCLAPFGRLVVYGSAGGQVASVAPLALVPGNQSIIGYYLGGWFGQRAQVAAEALGKLVLHIQAGDVRIQIGNVLPLSAAAEAHRILDTRVSVGKIVLKPWQSAT